MLYKVKMARVWVIVQIHVLEVWFVIIYFIGYIVYNVHFNNTDQHRYFDSDRIMCLVSLYRGLPV